jgi:hypothetical protein
MMLYNKNKELPIFSSKEDEHKAMLSKKMSQISLWIKLFMHAIPKKLLTTFKENYQDTPQDYKIILNMV